MELLDQWFWFVVLLPLAALAGWVIGRRGGERHSDSQVSKLSTTMLWDDLATFCYVHGVFGHGVQRPFGQGV